MNDITPPTRSRGLYQVSFSSRAQRLSIGSFHEPLNIGTLPNHKEDYDRQKSEIMSAIKDWDNAPADFDLPSFLDRLARVAEMERDRKRNGSEMNYRRNSRELSVYYPRTSSLRNKRETSIYHGRSAHADPNSQGNKRDSSTYEGSIDGGDTDAAGFDEHRSAAPSRLNGNSKLSRRGSLESTRTLRRENVIAIRQRDLRAMKVDISRRRTLEQSPDRHASASTEVRDFGPGSVDDIMNYS